MVDPTIDLLNCLFDMDFLTQRQAQEVVKSFLKEPQPKPGFHDTVHFETHGDSEIETHTQTVRFQAEKTHSRDSVDADTCQFATRQVTIRSYAPSDQHYHSLLNELNVANVESPLELSATFNMPEDILSNKETPPTTWDFLRRKIDQNRNRLPNAFWTTSSISMPDGPSCGMSGIVLRGVQVHGTPGDPTPSYTAVIRGRNLLVTAASGNGEFQVDSPLATEIGGHQGRVSILRVDQS